jgi:hypothetical protein
MERQKETAIRRSHYDVENGVCSRTSASIPTILAEAASGNHTLRHHHLSQQRWRPRALTVHTDETLRTTKLFMTSS